jgi:GTPase
LFVDRVTVELIAGKGGEGCCSFRREKYIPLGGPNGGNGGDGGSIILEARAGVNSLADYASQHFWRGDSGEHGSGSDCHGKSAEDMTLYVPPGTTIIDAKEGFVIKDLTTAGERVVVCRGGRGGKGNAHFKSATNRAPRETTPGGDGERRLVVLELKSIADVGLIGKPNAGKSTMLSRLSRARPEIADYPFTTKRPNLGRVRVDGERSFVLADIPGLIEGASEGVGLGHDFLRHVERAGLLVHLVEPSPADGTDPIENYHTIRHELGEYRQALAERPEIVVVTKCELPDANDVHVKLRTTIGRPVHLVSAQTGEGLKALIEDIAKQLAERLRTDDEIDPSVSAAPQRIPPHKRVLPPSSSSPPPPGS